MKKIAIITGASAGMGRDFALMLHTFFAVDELWLLARRKDRLTAVAAEIGQQVDAPVVRVEAMDIAGKAGIKNFTAMLEAEKAVCNDFVVTVLVNNAGFGTYGPFEETALEREIDMIELNCVTLTGFCGAVLPFLTHGSVIINTASLASFMPLGNFAVYGATKAFVLSFSVALSAELKDKGVKVCALCPGSVSTEFANVASGGVRKEVLHGLSSRDVVMHCLKSAVKGKRIIIMAIKWKLTAFFSRLLGRYACAAYTFRYCKRPHHAACQHRH